MKALSESYAAAVREAAEKSQAAVSLGLKLAVEIADNELFVSALEAKADLLRRVELELVARQDELSLLRQNVANLKAALAALKAGIPS